MDQESDPALGTGRLAGGIAIIGSVTFLAAGFLPLLRVEGAVIELAGLAPGGSLGAWLARSAHVWAAALAVGISGVTLLASPWSGGLRSGILLALGLSWLALVGHLVFQPLPGATIAAGAFVALLGIVLTLAAAVLGLGPARSGRPTGWIVRLVIAGGLAGGTLLARAAAGADESLAIWGLRALVSLPFFILALSIVAVRLRRHPRYTIALGAAAIACGTILLLADVSGRRPGPFLYAALAVFVAASVTLAVLTTLLTTRRPSPASVTAMLGVAALVAGALVPLTRVGGADHALLPTGSLGEALSRSPLPAMLVALSAAGSAVLLVTDRKRLGAGLLGGTAIFALALFPGVGFAGSPRAGVLYGLSGAVLLLLAALTGLGEPEAVRPIPETGLEPSPT